MNTTALSPRARILGTFAAAGVTALTGTLAVASSTAAAGAHTAGVPRISLETQIWCYQGDLGSVTFYYDDLADGHVPQQVREEVSDGSRVVWTRDDLYQEHGNYFNLEVFTFAGGTAPFDRRATVTYTITMTYDDGVTQSQSTAVDLAAECTGTPPTTAAPTTAGPPSDPDRFQLTEGLHGCGTSNGGAFLEWGYGDYPDGHHAARFDIDLLRNGDVVEHHTTSGGDPASDGASTMFDVRPDGNPGAALDPFFDQVTLQPASYSLSITVTYEDGATDKHIETFNLADLCNGVVNGRDATPPSTSPVTTTPPSPGSTTTTVPSGTLPETGSSNLTWVIGAVAGLLTTAGAALFAGVRRSRND